MSQHVYIAREGFKNNPIGIDEWERAIQACHELTAEAAGTGRLRHLLAKLPDNPRVWLSRTPYGLIQTQNPNIEMIRVMFRLASELGAAVYSDRLLQRRSAALGFCCLCWLLWHSEHSGRSRRFGIGMLLAVPLACLLCRPDAVGAAPADDPDSSTALQEVMVLGQRTTPDVCLGKAIVSAALKTDSSHARQASW